MISSPSTTPGQSTTQFRSNAPTIPSTPQPLEKTIPTGPLFSALMTGILLGVLLTGGTVFLLRKPSPPAIVLQQPPTPAPTPAPAPTATPSPLTVFVSGAVLHPGLYELPPTARIGDALAAAGGLVDGADPAVINQAERLYDGAQIHVPLPGAAPEETQPPAGLSGQPTAAPTNPDASQGRINVNTASLEELTTLPGVGPSKAAAIVANRPYESPQDLEKVPGIGAKTVAQLLDLITTQ